MINKIANNKTTDPYPILNSIVDIKEKLDYYRSLFGKVHDLSDAEFEDLKKDISTFFNIKPVHFTTTLPDTLIRISNNNRILKNKELGFLTEVSQLLAPPIEYVNYGRCNILNQQVAYCAIDLASAYWETKPQKGDVISISTFRLKVGSKANCSVIEKEKSKKTQTSHQLEEVFHLLEEFFIEVYSLPIDRNRSRDYIFSAELSSNQLFYPVESDKNIEAIVYPSVQRKKFGDNIAMKNELILKKYDLESVETVFVLDEYENLNPESYDPTADNIVGSLITFDFDIENNKILYRDDAQKIFNMFRMLQTINSPQKRFDNPEKIHTLRFNVSPSNTSLKVNLEKLDEIGKNRKISVIYPDGTRKIDKKFEEVENDLKEGKCKLL
jgi:hypothetical protein